MDKTSARLSGAGASAVLLWLWNVVLPYFMGVPVEGWPVMNAEVSVGFTVGVVAIANWLLVGKAEEKKEGVNTGP